MKNYEKFKIEIKYRDKFLICLKEITTYLPDKALDLKNNL